MKDVLVTTLKLFIICAIAAALLGVVYQVTEEPIATQQLEAANEAVVDASLCPMRSILKNSTQKLLKQMKTLL